MTLEITEKGSQQAESILLGHFEPKTPAPSENQALDGAR